MFMKEDITGELLRCKVELLTFGCIFLSSIDRGLQWISLMGTSKNLLTLSLRAPKGRGNL